MALSAGTLLGPYEIVSLVGSGGMGEVYLVQEPIVKGVSTPITVLVNWRPAPGK